MSLRIPVNSRSNLEPVESDGRHTATSRDCRGVITFSMPAMASKSSEWGYTRMACEYLHRAKGPLEWRSQPVRDTTHQPGRGLGRSYSMASQYPSWHMREKSDRVFRGQVNRPLSTGSSLSGPTGNM